MSIDCPNDGLANAMSITAASNAIDLSPSSTSLSGLDGINFFLAGMQAGFGPFVAVLLADEKWTQQNIGYVLSVSGLAGLGLGRRAFIGPSAPLRAGRATVPRIATQNMPLSTRRSFTRGTAEPNDGGLR
jgi:hypothetical protein